MSSDNEAKQIVSTDLPTARELWRQAREKYALALQIKPDEHETASNWGVALDNEAQQVANINLSAARVLWQQAVEKYIRALQIKPDNHVAANNCGTTLLHEVACVESDDMGEAQQCFGSSANAVGNPCKICTC